jgi:polynucleotide kinase-phosphatase
MAMKVPDLSLVVLIGASGSGKSTFAARHFAPTEVLSSDRMRAWVDDDQNAMEATSDAFDALHHLAALRLKRGRLTVIDATNVRREDRAPLVALARKHHAIPVAIVFKIDERVCQERNDQRPDREMGRHVVRNHTIALRRSLKTLKHEGFRHIYVLETPEQIEAVTVVREPLWCRAHVGDAGPFDIVGDVHGCADELRELLAQLGYACDLQSVYCHPAGRKAIFVGDLVDRGPDSVEVVRIVRAMCTAGAARCLPGNHDIRLMRKLRGREISMTHGLAESVAQIEALPSEQREAFVRDYIEFVDDLISHFVLDGGKLVVAHAGMKEELQGRGSAVVRDFALYGETTGETDEFGLPVRMNWAADYRGKAAVVYGHVAVPEAEWLNNTMDIDTGCVFGGKLTALRWPERQLVQIQARAQYSVPIKPLAPGDSAFSPGAPEDSGRNLQQSSDDLIDITDVTGKRFISTRLGGKITIRAEQSAAALEVMSRFAVDPRWLIYLPPTMSPCATSRRADFLEHPAEAFAYYREQGVPRVVCQEKHMGSRAVLVICKDANAARRRFGMTDGAIGECITRTGRRFFTDDALHAMFLERVRDAITAANLWSQLETQWVCLDAEIMPWNAKAESLLREQYAPVGIAGRAATAGALQVVTQAVARGLELGELPVRLASLQRSVESYTQAYQRYCWPVAGLSAVKVASFHLLASDSGVHTGRDHEWHVQTLAQLASADADFFVTTPHRIVDLFDEGSVADATAWWLARTEAGGEGMVVKPVDFVVRGPRGLVQPAIKCRGREYLRIIYGPDYTRPDYLERLRSRGLARKRGLALAEFALGIETLERFVRREPLRRVHECVFGVLALESEPVDPRL